MSAKVIKKSGKVAAKKVAKVRGNPCNVLNLNASRGLTIAHMKMFEPICPKVIKFEINTTTKHGMDHAGLRHFTSNRLPSFKYYNPTAEFEVTRTSTPDAVSSINAIFSDGTNAVLHTAKLDSSEIYAKLIATAQGKEAAEQFPTPEMPALAPPVRTLLTLTKKGTVALPPGDIKDQDALVASLPELFAAELRATLTAPRVKAADETA